MGKIARGLWNIVLSGYPSSGKTLLAKRLVAEYQNLARVNVDELTSMFFDEPPPCRDEYLVYSLIADIRDALLKRKYSVVIDSTAPDRMTREFLMATRARHINQLLVVLSVDRKTLIERNIARFGDAEMVFAWDKRWEEPLGECCLFKFRGSNREEFESYYALLTELLESETHPFRFEFRPLRRPLREIRKGFRGFLSVLSFR